MTAAAIILPLLVSACFGMSGPVVATRLPPRHATWLISAGGVAAALGTLAILLLLSSVLVGQIPGFAGEGHWSAAALRDHAPTEPAIRALALLWLLGAVAAVTFVAVRQGLTLLAAHRAFE